MTKLKLTLACYDYDRTRALWDGRVQPEGIDLNYIPLPPHETFFRMTRYGEFDASEMSLSTYAMSLFDENPSLIAIPVFPSKVFRHSCILINTNSGIARPKDLIGKRIGTPEYEMTAGVWIRGILEERYGVPVSSVSYLTGGLEEPGREEKVPLSLPKEIQVEAIPKDKTLSSMLETGEIDALYSAALPSCFTRGSKQVRLLFPNYFEVEKQYYEETKIFPIMHLIAIKRDTYLKNPWVAVSLYKAFVQAKELAYQMLRSPGAMKVSLPWLKSHLEETQRIMGKDFWSYGLDANYETLNALLRYSHRQGLTKMEMKPEELFAKETLNMSRS